MAGIAETLTTNLWVITPINLNAFFRWAGQASEEELDEVMAVIYTVEHRDPPWLYGGLHLEPIVLQRTDLGRTWQMMQLECAEENCIRCETGRGGWQFRWVGPWTCPTTIGDENTTAHEVILRAAECRCGRH